MACRISELVLDARDPDAELARLRAIGAVRIDIGQIGEGPLPA